MEAQQRSAASLANDRYLQPECHRYTIGRRTPMQMDKLAADRTLTPGPSFYSPWKAYPFSGPFGASGESMSIFQIVQIFFLNFQY